MNFDTFVGPAYSAAASLQDNQLSINYYVEIDKTPGAKGAKALLSAPGLSDLGQADYSGEVRGMWSLSVANKALLVIGNNVVLMQPAGVFTLSRPTYTYTLVGQLLTTKGTVNIRDNGQGGICVLVDGTNLYVYDVAAGTLVLSTDPAWLGSSVVCEIDGWFVFAKPDSQTFYVSPLYWNGVSAFDATYFALKDNAHDNIVALIEQNRELWVIGSETTEVWYNQGGAYFPFGRMQGAMQQYGCAATQSVARTGEGSIWLASSERGNNNVLMFVGYQHMVVSNPALSYQINQYVYVADAKGYVYTEEGHTFYVLIFPTANTTWVYDLTTENWHQRASYDTNLGQVNRQRANCVINFQNQVIAGDYSTGQIYWQTRSVYADGDYPLVSTRRATHIWDGQDRNRLRYDRLQLEFKPGSADASGTYSDPQAILSWSDDGGQTFSNDHYAPIGKVGQTTNRCIWRRLGISRDRVFQVVVSDPINRDITGASIQGSPYKS